MLKLNFNYPSTLERNKENISIFDFKLDDEDMATMRSLDQEKRFYNMSIEQLENFVLNRAIDR